MTHFITDDLTLEIERHLRAAAEVSIAAAFINFQGVNLLKKFIEKTRNDRVYSLNFLLDKDFHPHPAAREAIIKELCSIPGAKVRVFSDEERRMHMKVYIFSAGNTVSVIAGSHNPTGAGMTKNIEAGLLTSNKKAVSEARKYFNKYWSKAQKVVPNLDAYYKDPLFQPGQMVRHRESQEYGVIISDPYPQLRGEMWYYHVLWRNAITPLECPEKELRSITVIQGENPCELLELLNSTEIDENDYFREILRHKLLTPVKNGLFSYMASRTDIVPYQFKPLMKILASDNYRILIADEVGLGKTIEAGIIFTELKARIPKFRRALVVCPTNLKTKWKDEMESRFDEYFDLLNRDTFLKVADNASIDCFGIVSYDLLGNDEIIDFLKGSKGYWDIIILDEAHHLRNKNKRHRAVAQLVRATTALVMLSATPLNLGFLDLVRLLQILLPYDYRDVDDVEFGHRLEPNRYLFEAVNLVDSKPSLALRKLEEMERLCKYSQRISNELTYRHAKLLLESKESLSKSEIALIKDDLTNLNTLANVITRTRKEDVGIGVTREVITYQIEFTEIEQQLNQDLTNLARLMSLEGKKKGSKGNSLSVMMPQRQAASSLPAAIEYLQELVQKRSISTEEIIGEFEDNDEESTSVQVTSHNVLSEARRILSYFETSKDSFTDTKYKKLKEFLDTRATINGKLDKVIIFTGFRKTLSYLQTNLERDFGIGCTVEIHGDIQPLAERDDRRARFQNPEGPSILLCTEVGSEGLDMQFANKLINYDLPWNPMRIEQRIGRIDRHGQEAEKILVLNFAMSGTIEDNVVARLVERVKVFHDSLGPLNQVVGEIVSKLREDILNPTLTAKQREEKIRKYEQAIEIKARQEESFQRGKNQLIGQDKNFYEEIQVIQQNRRYISPEEIIKVIEIFCNQFPDQLSLTKDEGYCYTLALGTSCREHLSKQIRALQNINNSKRLRYIEKLREGYFNLTVDRETALKNKRLEFFTLHHPVIAGIVSGWSNANKTVVGRFSGLVKDISPGNYLLYTYYCEYERPNLEPGVYMYNLAMDINSGVVTQCGDELYKNILSGKLKVTLTTMPVLTQEIIERAEHSIKAEMTRKINDTANLLQRDLELIVRQKRESIYTTVEKEIAILSRRKKVACDSRVQEAVTKEIYEKKMELAKQIEKLSGDLGDITAKPELVGVAFCNVLLGGVE